MLAPRFRALRVLRPDIWLDAQLAANDVQQRGARLCISWQGKAGITQIAQLHCAAEPVVTAATLADHRQVGFGTGVMLDAFIVSGWKSKQADALRGRQQMTARHGQSSFLRY